MPIWHKIRGINCKGLVPYLCTVADLSSTRMKALAHIFSQNAPPYAWFCRILLCVQTPVKVHDFKVNDPFIYHQLYSQACVVACFKAYLCTSHEISLSILTAYLYIVFEMKFNGLTENVCHIKWYYKINLQVVKCSLFKNSFSTV